MTTDDTRKVVHSKSDFEWKHHVAHYTFIPMVIVVFGIILATFPVWYMGGVSFTIGLAMSWAALGITLGYISIFGDYIMPAEKYRKIKSGEWGCDSEQ